MSSTYAAETSRLLQQSIQIGRDTGLFEGLRDLYAQLPAARCARCNTCCGLLPPVAGLEALAWLDELAQAGPEPAARQAGLMVEHFFLNAVQKRSCPFSEINGCSRYDNRFFGCRAYGLWPDAAYEERARAAAEAAGLVRQAWRGLGVELPAEVTGPAPAYCRQSGPAHPPGPSAEFLDELEERAHGLGAGLPASATLSRFGGDLSYLVAGLSLGEQKALSAKVALTRAMLAGGVAEREPIFREAKELAASWIRQLIA